MTDLSAAMKSEAMDMQGRSPGVVLRSLVIGLTAFLTVVDLFATQAILPSLTRHYNVTPAAMGFAVNASTIGIAVAGLVIGFLSPHIDRRLGILLSLVLLAIPTTLLAVAPDLTVFTILRVAQGLCMASAFALTLAYLGEQCSSMDAGGAFAAYITGNVASNLIGRLVSAAVVDSFGLASNFYFFALLNLAGAVLVYFTIQRVEPMHSMPVTQSPFEAMIDHWRNPSLRAAFAIGFCILFAFIGTFTFVNFVLVRAPLSLSRMDLGFVYFAFLPSIVTTLFAGKAVARFWHSAGDLGGARGRRRRPPLDAVSASPGSPGRHGSGRRRNVLRAGFGDRLRRPGGGRKPRRGKRDLSCLLFPRWPRRQRRARPIVRPVRMDRLRCRRRCIAGDGGAPHRAPGAGSAVRRVSGIISATIASPRAATPARPMKAMLLPNLSLT
jgi:YNFM family putative membrane transporter